MPVSEERLASMQQAVAVAPPIPRSVEIIKVLNGFIVRCGCQSVVFNDKEVMLKEIGRYFDNPDAVEKEYLAKA